MASKLVEIVPLVHRRGNAIHGHMADFRIVARGGLAQVKALLAVIAGPDDSHLPPDARMSLQGVAVQFVSVDQEIMLCAIKVD